jgi:starch-binding outer membrane protein, SusD/RagB family
MKNFKNIFLFALLLITSLGCDKDLLDTIPNDRVSTTLFWKTDKDAVYATNAVYTLLEDANSFTNWDAMTEIGHVSKSTNSQSLVEKGAYDALSTVMSTEWNREYQGIQAANIFLDNVDKIVTQDPATISRLKGEVRTLRAFFYIRLAFLWGDVPLVKTETTLEASRKLTRTPVAEVWDFISTELTEAAALLPITQTDKGRVTKGAALAIKARAMLFAGRYSDAAIAAKQVIDLNAYNIYPNYSKLFTYEAENNSEVIFDKQYIKSTAKNNLFLIMCTNSEYPGSTANLVPTKQVIDLYQMKNGKEITDPTSGFDPYNPYLNRDPRLKYNFVVVGSVLFNGKTYDSRPGSGTSDAVGYAEIATATGFNINKYLIGSDLSDPTNGGLNTIFLRYAEVLLTYAEAKIETNSIDQSVLDAINLVRQRSDVMMPVYSGVYTQADLRQIIRTERVRELPFEGLHYFDIRRWRTAETVIPGMLLGMTYTDITTGTLKTISLPGYVRSFDKNKEYLWPIPQKELDLNPSLAQNPGW